MLLDDDALEHIARRIEQANEEIRKLVAALTPAGVVTT